MQDFVKTVEALFEGNSPGNNISDDLEMIKGLGFEV